MIDQLRELAGRSLIREMENGGFVRLVMDEKSGRRHYANMPKLQILCFGN